tara:strand:+ start:324 stop:509 length:186 start_codon:yes stop_codon:yes gene_type:complete
MAHITDKELKRDTNEEVHKMVLDVSIESNDIWQDVYESVKHALDMYNYHGKVKTYTRDYGE